MSSSDGDRCPADPGVDEVPRTDPSRADADDGRQVPDSGLGHKPGSHPGSACSPAVEHVQDGCRARLPERGRREPATVRTARRPARRREAETWT